MAYEDLAPNFALAINGQELSPSVSRLVRSVEYESADGMADEAKVVFTNPDFELTDAKLVQAGSELNIWMGYGPDLSHIGMVQIVRVTPNYPQNQIPTIAVQGYTLDSAMMDNSPEKGDARRWKDAPHSDVVTDKALAYGMEPDVDDTPGEPRSLIQKAGLSDFDVVQGLANITGYIFWVDGDERRKWTLHFKTPGNVLKEIDQPDFVFRYRQGDASSLLSFRPELLIKGVKTKIKVQVKNTRTGKMMTEVVEEENQAPDVKYEGREEEQVEESLGPPSTIKLYLNSYSFEVIANRKFETEAQVKEWASQWFRRHRESFILGDGKVMGNERLMARQTHTFDGLGKTLNGKYYFSRVRHKAGEGIGYLCDFSCRKQK